ncbi:MAG: type I-E CRISPR-associated protein Cas6/Cse3/CasE [Pseudoramibacter sp.]|jgi:CRISPR system Cascade subunit CasE
MYLSKIELDLRKASVRQALRDCQDMHRNVMKFFHTDRASAGVLYRLNQSRRGVAVYVQSEAEPRESQGTIHDGMTLSGCRDISRMVKSIEAGNTYVFNLLACPSKKVCGTGEKNNKRRFLTRAEDQIEWLSEKGRQGGFALAQATAESGQTASSQKGNGFRFASVRFRGILKVTDAEAFKATLAKGIGPEKAYGMGLLFIR